MNNIVPQNNTVLCIQVQSDRAKQNTNGFVYENAQLPIYKIVKLSQNFKNENFKENDMIVTNSTGTKLLSDGTEYFLFKEENIAAKIL